MQFILILGMEYESLTSILVKNRYFIFDPMQDITELVLLATEVDTNTSTGPIKLNETKVNFYCLPPERHLTRRPLESVLDII